MNIVYYFKFVIVIELAKRCIDISYGRYFLKLAVDSTVIKLSHENKKVWTSHY